MKIFSCEQIREIDRYTIEHEPVKSIDLMERAAGRIFDWIIMHYPRSRSIIIFAGPGNNGGDGLVLARRLIESGYTAEVHYVKTGGKETEDWQLNRQRLEVTDKEALKTINMPDDFPLLSDENVIIDAIFGSGLTRPPEGLAAEIIMKINSSGCAVVSIDIPSGLFGEDNTLNISDNIVRSDITLTLQFPKLSFMFADNYKYTGDFRIVPIGLHRDAIRDTATPYYYMETTDIAPLLKERGKFDHKGVFGHGLLVAGSRGKSGAAILAAKASLRSGIGLLTCHTAGACCSAIQSALPEAMIQPDENSPAISSVTLSDSYSAIGLGPGIGTSDEACKALHQLLKNCNKPMVIDADAINILGLNKKWISLLKPGTILTPHPKEFERIAGKTGNDYLRLKAQQEFSANYSCTVVVKGAHTSVSLPDGRVYFNSTGNPGMATAGSGDVLTGIILSLLSQGYSSEDAAKTGVFLHGLAGDIASEKIPFEAMIASDITENIGNAFLRIKGQSVI